MADKTPSVRRYGPLQDSRFTAAPEGKAPEITGESRKCFPWNIGVSNGRLWTGDEIAWLRRLVASGLTDAQIGERMDRDRIVILRKRNELELRPGQSPGMTAMLRRLNAMRRAKMARA